MPKSGVYEIAKYIPLKIRRQMVAVKYHLNIWQHPVCAEGKCPMGWLAEDLRQPEPREIARLLQMDGLSPVRRTSREALEAAALQFTSDWDNGKIKNLRRALGVPTAARSC